MGNPRKRKTALLKAVADLEQKSRVVHIEITEDVLTLKPEPVPEEIHVVLVTPPPLEKEQVQVKGPTRLPRKAKPRTNALGRKRNN